MRRAAEGPGLERGLPPVRSTGFSRVVLLGLFSTVRVPRTAARIVAFLRVSSAVVPLAIRAATPDDARRIAEIHVAGWQSAYRGQMPDSLLDGLSVDLRAETRRRDLETPRSPEHRTWVAEDGGRIVAFAMTGPSRDADAAADVAELFALYADPARWGTGSGRALMAHVIADLSGRGMAEITLWVLASNARARRFYGIAGFRADEVERHESFAGASLKELRCRRACNAELRPS